MLLLTYYTDTARFQFTGCTGHVYQCSNMSSNYLRQGDYAFISIS